jgi:hypothetical protein
VKEEPLPSPGSGDAPGSATGWREQPVGIDHAPPALDQPAQFPTACPRRCRGSFADPGPAPSCPPHWLASIVEQLRNVLVEQRQRRGIGPSPTNGTSPPEADCPAEATAPAITASVRTAVASRGVSDPAERLADHVEVVRSRVGGCRATAGGPGSTAICVAKNPGILL